MSSEAGADGEGENVEADTDPREGPVDEGEDEPEVERARVNSLVGFVGSIRPDKRSDTSGLVITDEPARGATKTEDPSREPLGETSEVKKGKHGSVYDVCEIFSPPQISRSATRQGLRAGWSLDLYTEWPVTGRRWDCGSA